MDAVNQSRKRPRDYSSEPGVFGKAQQIQWESQADRAGMIALRAARIQHEHAVDIRKTAKENKLTLKKYAAIGGTPYDRLTKVLRGDLPMRLEDLAVSQFVFEFVKEQMASATKRRRVS